MKEHSMAPDELRALADALEPMAKAPRFADFDVPAFCAWVRACADEKPVAWTDRHTAVTRFALWRFINEALSRSAHAAQKGSYEPVENVAKYQDDAKTAEEARAMLAAAPAAPQAEPETFESELRSFADTPEQVAFVEKLLAPQAAPCVGNDPTCPCQDGDACHYKDADGTKAWPVYNPFLRECTEAEEQAEPKRPQTCLWSRADDDTDMWETACGNAFTLNEGSPADNKMVFCCYCGRELKGEIGDSDAE